MSSAKKETNSPTIEHIRKGTTLKEVMPFIANSSILRKGYFVSPCQTLRSVVINHVRRKSNDWERCSNKEIIFVEI